MKDAPVCAQRVAVVTGGARGIGRAIGDWFLRHGHQVVLLDRDGATLERAVAELASVGSVRGVHCDVSDAAQVRRSCERPQGRAAPNPPPVGVKQSGGATFA